MAKISKRDDAPEGDIKVSIGSTHFRVKDGEPHETDDLKIVEAVQASFSEFFVVEYDDGSESHRDVASAEAKALRELHKEQEKAKIQHVTKDMFDPAAPIPTSVDEVEEAKETRAEIKQQDNGPTDAELSKGGKR